MAIKRDGKGRGEGEGEAVPMRRPPNLHLHSFQRISQEWNVWRSPEGTISLSALFLAEAKGGLERAYGKFVAPSRCRRGSKRGASSGDREGGHCRACKQRNPSGICSSVSEISTGKTAPSFARNLSIAIVDHNKDTSIYRDVSQNIWESASRVDANKNF